MDLDMTDKTAEQIIKQCAKDAVREYREESTRDRSKEIRKKVRKLMWSYNDLQKHVDDGVYSAEELREDEIKAIMQPGDRQIDALDIELESIFRSKVKTIIMLSHIDRCLGVIKSNQDIANLPEKYEVFYRYYIGRESDEYLADEYFCSDRTIRKWLVEMESDMAVLLFGAEGLVL